MREKEILLLVARGHKDREIAEALHIGLSTVNTHIVNIRDKIDARNRAHAVYIAFQRHLLFFDDNLEQVYAHI